MAASMNCKRSNGRFVWARSSANRCATRRIVRCSPGERRGWTLWFARRRTPATNSSIASDSSPCGSPARAPLSVASLVRLSQSARLVTDMCDSFLVLWSYSGGGAERRGLEDQLSRRRRVDDGDCMRCAGDLDRAMGAGTPGHEVLEGDRDGAVLLAEDEPRRVRPPERPVAGRRAERLLRDRSLRGRHPCGLRRRHVRGELMVEAVEPDRKVGGAVAAEHGLERLAEGAAGEHGSERDAALAGLGR